VGKISVEGNATFCDGAVDTLVMADSGSDITVMPSSLLTALQKANPAIKASPLAKVLRFENASTAVPPLRCSRMVQINAELRIRYGEKLML